jgi:hypothetical protein
LHKSRLLLNIRPNVLIGCNRTCQCCKDETYEDTFHVFPFASNS